MSTLYPIPRQKRDVTFLATEGQTAFGPPGFVLFDPLDIIVGLKIAAEDPWTLLDPASYSVGIAPPGTGWPAFPIVTLAAPLAAGATVRLRGARLHERLTDVTQGGAVRSVAIEKELDRQSVVLQELRRDVDELISGAAIGLPALTSKIIQIVNTGSEVDVDTTTNVLIINKLTATTIYLPPTWTRLGVELEVYVWGATAADQLLVPDEDGPETILGRPGAWKIKSHGAAGLGGSARLIPTTLGWTIR